MAIEPTLAAIGPTIIHPIQPIPRMLPHPKVTTFKRNLKQDATNKNVWYCYKPERQIIPDAVVPPEMPKGISEYNYKNNKNNRNSFFQVRYDNTYIRYTYGNNGYTRENAYMEAGRCLRYLLIQTISMLDSTMGINPDMYETLDELLADYDGLPIERTLSLATATTTDHSSCIIYDENDEIDMNFGNFDDLPYESHTSSMDIQPLIVNFDDDLIIDI